LVALAMLGLTACATQQGPRPVASYYEATRDSQVEASGPVAADDASMRVKSSSRQVSSASSRVTPDGETSREKSTEIIAAVGQRPTAPSKAKETVKETTETTTVVGSIPVAAPDSEVKFTNQ